MNLTDCTDTLRLVYDRGKGGYGVPVPGVRFKDTSKLSDALTAIRRDLEQIGWWDYIESVLTAGLWVDKKGAHGDGEAWDFDGVVLRPNPLVNDQKILVYRAGVSRWGFKNSNYEIQSLPDRIKTRIACLLSLRFGVVLTAGYKSKDGKYHHEDHIHCDLSRTVKWRGSRSQVVCLQETLNAWFNAGLVVDGVLGRKTWDRWKKVIPLKLGLEETAWLDWLKMIAFDPPKDVK